MAIEKLQELFKAHEQEVVEATLRMLPGVVGQLIMRGEQVHNLQKEFYATHKDLQEHKNLVAQTIQKVEAQHPGKKFSDILEMAAGEARTKISKISQVSLTADKKPELEQLDHLAGMFK